MSAESLALLHPLSAWSFHIVNKFACKKSYKNMRRAYCESVKNSAHNWVQTLRVETLWVVYFSKIYDFDSWRIGLKGFPGVAGSNHCNVLFNGLGEISRGSILSESSKNVMGSSFDPRSHMRLHLLRFQICSFWHAITLGSSLCGQPEELLCNWNYEVYIKIIQKKIWQWFNTSDTRYITTRWVRWAFFISSFHQFLIC